MTSLTATVWTDYVCPWAHAGRAHTAWLRTRGVRVDLRAFELHPETPVGGVPLEHGRRLDRLYDRLLPIADDLGVPFAKPPRTQNTRRALELLEVVRSHEPDHLAALDDALDHRYWVDGGAIDTHDDLAEVVTAIGLDPGLVDLAEHTGGELVDEAMGLAREAGVAGTPAWKVGELVIPGLQDASTFHRWLERLIARHPG